MAILTRSKQLDTNKVKDLVYGLEKTSKRIRLYVPVHTPESSILQRGGVMRLKSRMKNLLMDIKEILSKLFYVCSEEKK